MRTQIRLAGLCLALSVAACHEESAADRAIREAKNKPPDAGVSAQAVPARATLLASGQNVPRSLVVEGGQLFWLNEGRRAEGKPGIYSVSASGGEVKTLFGGGGVETILVDDQFVYWIQPEQEVVMKVSKSGGAPQTVLTEQVGLSSFVQDKDALYWTSSDGLVRFPKAGGKPKQLATGMSPPVGLAMDGNGFYWYSAIQGDLFKVPKSGGTPKSILHQELTLHDFLLDGGYLYWALGSQGKTEFRRVSTAGGKAQTLCTGQSIPVAMAADEGHLYWTTGDTIMRVAKAGGSPDKVVDGADRALSIAVDGSSVYWTDREGRVEKVAK